MDNHQIQHKVDRFTNELHLIEDRYREWFATQTTAVGNRLHHYYNFDWQLSQVRFGFADDCQLPDEIQATCMEAFYRNFR